MSKKSKSPKNVVLLNGLTGRIEEHTISMKNGNYGDDIRSIMFDDYIKKYGSDKYGKCLGNTPNVHVQELLSIFKMKEGYKNIICFNDDCGLLRNPEWNMRFYTPNHPYGYFSTPIVFLNVLGWKSNGETLYGDLFYDKELG